MTTQTEALKQRITDYLSNGGLFNPELANHVSIRDLLIECREALAQPEHEPVLNPEDCSKDVFEHGTSMGLFVMPKEEAEQYCKDETKRTGYKHDWHYVAGRVHVKALIPTPQRTWVGLTDEEMKLIDPDGFEDNLPQMIQQALKEKNT